MFTSYQEVVDEAFRVALEGKPGSVHIDLPKCVSMSKFDQHQFKDISFHHDQLKKKIENISFDKVSDIIHQAERPVLLVGQGCNNYAKELREFAISSNIPVTTTIHAMGVFDETDPLSLEFVGMHGNVTANYAIQDADLIIALGTRFDDRITGAIDKYAPKANKGIIHVNKNDQEINKALETNYNFHMDCGDFLKAIKPKFNLRAEWFNKINNWKENHPFKFNQDAKFISTQEVISAINDHLINKDEYIITTGVGNHQMMSSQFIKWRYPKSFISSGSLGVMGVGLPYAIGCQIANPNKLVLDIDGDGYFNHTLYELKTIQNYNLPIKIAILNDTNLSMVRAWEELFFNKQYTATNLVKNPDYADLAESFGIKGIKCDNRQDLKSKVDEFLSYDKSILCEFKVIPNLCLPLVSPGAALDEIILFDDKNININSDLPPS